MTLHCLPFLSGGASISRPVSVAIPWPVYQFRLAELVLYPPIGGGGREIVFSFLVNHLPSTAQTHAHAHKQRRGWETDAKKTPARIGPRAGRAMTTLRARSFRTKDRPGETPCDTRCSLPSGVCYESEPRPTGEKNTQRHVVSLGRDCAQW